MIADKILNGVPYCRVKAMTAMKVAEGRPKHIVAAAIVHDGRLWTGSCHADIEDRMWEMEKIYYKDVGEDAKMFLSDNNITFTRYAAAKLAYRAGQIAEKTNKLISSDLGW
jgi:hypothetical protein